MACMDVGCLVSVVGGSAGLAGVRACVCVKVRGLARDGSPH